MEENVKDDELYRTRLSLPEEAGVYKYFDENGKIIYVGKARNLKKRVNSYFTKTHPDAKTRVLVSKIRRLEFVVTRDDVEALILENNLIKEYQPRYNILLRDGKSYPYICIKNERFPRVFPTRNREKDKSLYFGPYPHAATMYSILRFIRENFKLRTCNYNLSEKNIAAGKFRPCLEFQIGKCKAPCVGKQAEDEYNDDIQQIKKLLKGNFKAVIDYLREQMLAASEKMEYERAHYLKTRMEQVQKHKQKSTVVSEKIDNVEVITLASREGLTVVNHFKMLNGVVVKTHVFDVWRKNEETDAEVLNAVLDRLTAEDEDFFKEILTNLDAEAFEGYESYKIVCPRRGDELKIVELSVKNCEAKLDEKLTSQRERFGESPNEKLLRQAQKDLRLAAPPYHIEGFDNSNIQGYAPVSSCVVFKNGKPSRRDYRVFNVDTVEGPNDFASMYEAVTKRYRSFVAENKPLPDLILIDGGKGQLSFAVQALKDLGIIDKVAIISIAKRLEEIYYKDDPYPLHIDKKSSTLKLLQHIRNESHDTAVAFHRKKRDAKTLKTELTEIKGVGKATAAKLLTKLRSVKKIKEASLETLAEAIGESKAKIVFDHFRNAQK